MQELKLTRPPGHYPLIQGDFRANADRCLNEVAVTLNVGTVKNFSFYPWQQEALFRLIDSYMFKCPEDGVHGMILGLYMALGKTLTSLTFIYLLCERKLPRPSARDHALSKGSQKKKTQETETPFDAATDRAPSGPVLIVCEKTALTTWIDEISKWYPQLKYLHYNRSQHRSEAVLAELAHDVYVRKQYHVVMTTYDRLSQEMVRCMSVLQRKAFAAISVQNVASALRNLASRGQLPPKAGMEMFLFRVPHAAVVCDEAHVMRNSKTKRAQTLAHIPTLHRTAVTGTAFNNSPLDIRALFLFLGVRLRVVTDDTVFSRAFEAMMTLETSQKVADSDQCQKEALWRKQPNAAVLRLMIERFFIVKPYVCYFNSLVCREFSRIYSEWVLENPENLPGELLNKIPVPFLEDNGSSINSGAAAVDQDLPLADQQRLVCISGDMYREALRSAHYQTSLVEYIVSRAFMTREEEELYEMIRHVVAQRAHDVIAGSQINKSMKNSVLFLFANYLRQFVAGPPVLAMTQVQNIWDSERGDAKRRARAVPKQQQQRQQQQKKKKKNACVSPVSPNCLPEEEESMDEDEEEEDGEEDEDEDEDRDDEDEDEEMTETTEDDGADDADDKRQCRPKRILPSWVSDEKFGACANDKRFALVSGKGFSETCREATAKLGEIIFQTKEANMQAADDSFGSGNGRKKNTQSLRFPDELIALCASMENFTTDAILRELLEHICDRADPGHPKILIYVHYVYSAEHAAHVARERFGADSVLVMYSKDSTETRSEKVRRFQEDPSIRAFIISLSMGSNSLNLFRATDIVIVTDDWNPVKEAQAQCRGRRPGQTQPIHCFRIVIRNTIGEAVVQRASRKMDNARLVDWLAYNQNHCLAGGRDSQDLSAASQRSTPVTRRPLGRMSYDEVCALFESPAWMSYAAKDAPPPQAGSCADTASNKQVTLQEYLDSIDWCARASQKNHYQRVEMTAHVLDDIDNAVLEEDKRAAEYKKELNRVNRKRGASPVVRTHNVLRAKEHAESVSSSSSLSGDLLSLSGRNGTEGTVNEWEEEFQQPKALLLKRQCVQAPKEELDAEERFMASWDEPSAQHIGALLVSLFKAIREQATPLPHAALEVMRHNQYGESKLALHPLATSAQLKSATLQAVADEEEEETETKGRKKRRRRQRQQQPPPSSSSFSSSTSS